MKQINIISNEIFRQNFGNTLNSWNTYEVGQDSKVKIDTEQYDVVFDDAEASWFEIDKIVDKTIFLKKFENFGLMMQGD